MQLACEQVSVSRDGRQVAVGLENGGLGLLSPHESQHYIPLIAAHKGTITAIAAHQSL